MFQKIHREKIKERVLQSVDEDLRKNIDRLIDEAVATLKIEVVNLEVTPEEAERICDYILADFNRAKFGWMGLLFACALGVGGTSWFHSDNRYTIEEEYSFMSICVGKHSDYLSNYKTQRQKQCVEIIKACQKEGKTLKECVNR